MRMTRTMTRKPSVATATKLPESRMITEPTASATSDTSRPARMVAATQPSGSGPTIWSRWMPASQPGRLGRNAAFFSRLSVSTAEIYTPNAMKPM